jgi:hypothetical protein
MQPTTLRFRTLLALTLLVLTACADEIVGQPGEATTCEGPTWTYQRDLGFTRWSDSAGQSAESGGVVLVAWQEREENTGGPDSLRGVVLDAETGAVRRELDPMQGTFNDVRVRGVDGGFYLFAQEGFVVGVYHLAFGGTSFRRLLSIPRGDLAFDAVVTTDAVLAFGEHEMLVFDHDGGLAGRLTDGPFGTLTCRSGTFIPGGRVLAWCLEDTGGEVLLAMDEDGSDPVVTPQPERLEWTPTLGAIDDGVLFVSADGNDIRVALLDGDGGEIIPATSLPLRSTTDDDAEVIGGNACTATCLGLTIAVQGDAAVVDISTSHQLAERFHIRVEGDELTIDARGRREVVSRQSLTSTGAGPLSTWTRFAPHVPILDGWPPQTLVVERSCLRSAVDDGSATP